MKAQIILSSVFFVFTFLTACEKEEVTVPQSTKQVDQVEESLEPGNRLLVTMRTGRDDLRGGNRAFIKVVLMDGTHLPEQLLSTGLGSGSLVTSRINLPRSITTNQVRSIHIRHDGNPRSGYPFDSYDNWDLTALQINLANASFVPVGLLYNSNNDSRVTNLTMRFTGVYRHLNLPIRAIGTEPDFIILRFYATPSGINLVIRNQGPGSGTVTLVNASTSGATAERTTRVFLASRQFSTLTIGAPLTGAVTCTISGVDLQGRPEFVTANNRLKLFIK